MKIIEREITTTGEGKPCMVLRPIEKYDKVYTDQNTGKPYKRRTFILLDNLWMYSEKHNPDQFMSLMTAKTMYICKLFEIPVPTRKQQFIQLMMSIADTIQNGIDDLVKTPPIPASPEEPSSIIRVKPVPLSDIVASGTIH
jgi:hypothetical protein